MLTTVKLVFIKDFQVIFTQNLTPLKIKLFFIFLVFCIKLNAQNYVFGKITTEDLVELQLVTIINLTTEEQTQSDNDGHFMIKAEIGDEIRIVKPRYERNFVKINAEHFKNPIAISLKRIPEEIEEVELKYLVTGILKDDIKHFGDRGKVKVMKDDVADYIFKKSDVTVLLPKQGEFVQPVGPGFSVGAVNPQWDDIDFMQFLIAELGEDFFIKDLQLQKTEIQPFVFYIFKNFERRKILLYGNCSSTDMMRFFTIAERKVKDYKAGIPNTIEKKKRK